MMNELIQKVVDKAIEVGCPGLILVVAGSQAQVASLLTGFDSAMPDATAVHNQARLLGQDTADIRVVNGQHNVHGHLSGLSVNEIYVHDPVCLIDPFTYKLINEYRKLS